MKQVYVFTRSKSEHFTDAVSVGDLFLAPILDSQVDGIKSYCEDNGITCKELTFDNVVTDTETEVIITSYADAKLICSYYAPPEEI